MYIDIRKVVPLYEGFGISRNKHHGPLIGLLSINY